MIVYKGRDEDYDVSFWFYDQSIRVDWGDGIIEDFVTSKAGLDRVNHKFVDGSGKLDSNGERCGLRRFNRAGDYPGRTSKLSCSQRTGFAGGNRTRK